MSVSQSITTKNHTITHRALCWVKKEREQLGWNSLQQLPELHSLSLLGVWGVRGPSRQEIGWAQLHPAEHKTNIADTAMAITLVSWHPANALSTKGITLKKLLILSALICLLFTFISVVVKISSSEYFPYNFNGKQKGIQSSFYCIPTPLSEQGSIFLSTKGNKNNKSIFFKVSFEDMYMSEPKS